MQRLHLKEQTNGQCISHTPSQLRWRYTTCPSPLGRSYDVLISYSLENAPDVFVISPNIFKLTEEKIPHLYYSKKDRGFGGAACLCLYRTKYGEWASTKLIAATLLPWVDLWLFYFEHWLTTGDWQGGGEHPE